jgi:hypothetical protein
MMMDHGSAIFTVVCRFACHRQSISLHDITGIEFLVHYRYAKPCPNPAEALGETLCDSLLRMDSADNLVDILGCCHEEIECPMLGAAFFERGLLASKSFPIVPIYVLALGDIGYETEAGNILVVDNVHQYVQAESGTLSWTGCPMFTSGREDLGDTPTENIVSQSGISYQRRRQACPVLMLG